MSEEIIERLDRILSILEDMSQKKYKRKRANVYIPGEFKGWKDDYLVYRKYAQWGFREAHDDKVLINDIQKLYPDIDIHDTIKKDFLEYWITEKAWRLKAETVTGNPIDWKQVIRNIFRYQK